LRGWIKEGYSSYEAAMKCQTHMLNLAEAFIEHLVLEKFQEAIKDVEDPSINKVLTKLCSLYALSTLEKHKGWFLEQDYFAGAKTKAIRRLVDELCLDLRKEAGALVDAFAIPDSLLAAEIVVDKS
jgi:acyl-CoA oxidase